MPNSVNIQKLVELIGRGVSPAFRTEQLGLGPFADVTGYHVYGELNLTLNLTAATDTSDAQRLLKVLQEYTLIAEACAAEASAVLLEVQGERIHLLIPAASVDANSVADVLRFAVAFTREVYDRISKSAGADFRGFKMAVDHGRAIMVASGGQANGSIVSLGPCANAPAKQLKRHGTAAHLRMRSKHYAHCLPPPSASEWIDVPVLNPIAAVAALASAELGARFSARSKSYIEESLQSTPSVLFANADYLNSFQGGYVGQAIKVQGFAIRADLDGFSKQVEAAFNSGNAAIANLVQRFLNIMQYPAQFRARIGKTIDLPWAGDCANLIVLPNGVSYADAREYLPVKAASEWHAQRAGVDSTNRKWSEQVGLAKWAVGVAGGDDKEGSDGYILVAPLAGRSRDFLVAAGWGVGRSLDAQESDGVAGDDTVIHQIDYAVLDTPHRSSFKKLDSIFWISHGLTVASLRSGGAASLASQAPIFVPNIVKPVPVARPWCYGYS